MSDACDLLVSLGVQLSVRPGPVASDALPSSKSRDRRKREFAEGRAAARCALRGLGIENAEIPRAETREPIWPTEVSGSITHCDGCCAAAVAWQKDFVGIGIDVEPHAPMPPGTLALIAGAADRDALKTLSQTCPEVFWDRLIFSGKEAAFKASFQFHRVWPEFDAVRAVVDKERQTFEIIGSVPNSGLLAGELTLCGHWSIQGGFIRTAVAVTRADLARFGFRGTEAP